MPEPLFPDTPPKIEEKLLELFRAKSSVERLAMIPRMWSLQVDLAKAGLRERYPDAGPEEMAKRLCAFLHGREIALQVFGWDPEVEGY